MTAIAVGFSMEGPFRGYFSGFPPSPERCVSLCGRLYRLAYFWRQQDKVSLPRPVFGYLALFRHCPFPCVAAYILAHARPQPDRVPSESSFRAFDPYQERYVSFCVHL